MGNTLKLWNTFQHYDDRVTFEVLSGRKNVHTHFSEILNALRINKTHSLEHFINFTFFKTLYQKQKIMLIKYLEVKKHSYIILNFVHLHPKNSVIINKHNSAIITSMHSLYGTVTLSKSLKTVILY